MEARYNVPLKLSNSTRKLLPIVKQKLREKVPKLDLKELRRARGPFHEALLIELQESHHRNAYEIFKEIVDFDLKSSKELTNDKELMERIFDDLKKAEYSSKEDEVEILMTLGRHIEKGTAKIRWLVEKFYSRALMMIKNYQFEGSRNDAIVQFWYGKLSSELGKYEEAVKFLNASFEISFGVEEWMVEDESEKAPEKLFAAALNGLCKSLIKLSKQVINEHPEQALELSIKSLKLIRANKIFIMDSLKLELDSELAIGDSFMALNHFDKAMFHFEVAIELATSSGFCDDGFKALLKMSEHYKSSDNDEMYEESLNRAMSYAKSNFLVGTFEGDILTTLGRFWIKRQKFTKALEYLNESVKIFEETDETKKLQEVRMMMAVPLGKFQSFSFHFYASQ
jgi:tetratricopeptide (TPR) repeat protein